MCCCRSKQGPRGAKGEVIKAKRDGSRKVRGCRCRWGRRGRWGHRAKRGRRVYRSLIDSSIAGGSMRIMGSKTLMDVCDRIYQLGQRRSGRHGPALFSLCLSLLLTEFVAGLFSFSECLLFLKFLVLLYSLSFSFLA